jgi:cytochrome c2
MPSMQFPTRTLIAALALASVPAAALAEGDAALGKDLFTQRCGICHSVTDGETRPTGPNLKSVVGRKAGEGGDYTYSAAMKDSGLTWDAANLNAFLENPAGKIPGTYMPIPTPDAKERADLIGYLESLKAAP